MYELLAELTIVGDLTMVGENRDTVILSGNNQFRIFFILNLPGLPASVKIEGITLTEGKAGSGTGFGGAIRSTAELLTLQNILVTNHDDDQAAISQEGGTLVVRDSLFTNNRLQSVRTEEVFSVEISNSIFSGNKGTSIVIMGVRSGPVTINDSKFTSNKGYGSIFSLSQVVHITSSIFEGNISDNGAVNVGSVVVVGTTFKNNSSTGGGAAIKSRYVSVTDSRFENNFSLGDGGAIDVWGNSGSTVVASINDTLFDGNSSGGDGGAISGGLGSISLTRTSLLNNSSDDSGGGVYNLGRVDIRETIFSNNIAANKGGGLYADNGGFVLNSEITGNSAKLGGGLYNTDIVLIVKNTTISGNNASDEGGGIYSTGSFSFAGVTLRNATIANNGAKNAGGNISNVGASTASQINSIIANATESENCSGLITTLGNNIDSGDTCGLGREGDQPNTDPLLLALANNGGTTQTMALDAGSPAIDAGQQNECDKPENIDQRFNYRVDVDQRFNYRDDGRCDIGAFEENSVRANSGLIQFELIEKTVNRFDTDFTFVVSRTDGSEGAGSAWLGFSRKSTAKSGYTAIPVQRLSWVDGEYDEKEITVGLNNEYIVPERKPYKSAKTIIYQPL